MVYLVALGIGYILEDMGNHADFGRFLQAAAVIVAIVHALLIVVTMFNADR